MGKLQASREAEITQACCTFILIINLNNNI